jgi:hypothetical protein
MKVGVPPTIIPDSQLAQQTSVSASTMFSTPTLEKPGKLLETNTRWLMPLAAPPVVVVVVAAITAKVMLLLDLPSEVVAVTVAVPGAEPAVKTTLEVATDVPELIEPSPLTDHVTKALATSVCVVPTGGVVF